MSLNERPGAQLNSKEDRSGSPRTKWKKGKVATWDIYQSPPHLHNVSFSKVILFILNRITVKYSYTCLSR